MSSRVTDESYVTLATNENYALGALTLGQSLRRANTNRKLTCMITADLPAPLVYVFLFRSLMLFSLLDTVYNCQRRSIDVFFDRSLLVRENFLLRRNAASKHDYCHILSKALAMLLMNLDRFDSHF